ncbi:MAG: acyl-CoA dehydrogenase family protein [Proteobacteria bacterium]|nr:acyl-CoA dehydrogenase family protein [Pseudomonadota bacterium]
MDFSLSPEHQAAQATARKFSEEEISPQVDIWEEKKTLPRGLVRQMGKLGFFASAFPREYGGSELGFLAHGLICEEVSRVWSSLRHLFNTQGMTCPLTILKHGSEVQKQRLSANILKILIANDTLGYKKANRSPAG